MPGISSRQNSHHVAQKFRNTTLPRKSFSAIFFPSGRTSSKSGASGRSFISCNFGTAPKFGTACAYRAPPHKKNAASRSAGRAQHIESNARLDLAKLLHLREQFVVRQERL